MESFRRYDEENHRLCKTAKCDSGSGSSAAGGIASCEYNSGHQAISKRGWKQLSQGVYRFWAMARMGHTPREYFEAFGSDIVHIHFVDGNPTGHLAWGDGSRDLKTDLAVLEEYGYQGYLSLETATQRYYEKPWSAEMKTLKSFEE